jgi:hypothetical protein
MNLRGLANQLTSQINPNQAITWVQNTGYTTNAAGKRTPTTTSSSISAQVQALSGRDLDHMDGMNVQGVMRTVFMYGNPQGVVRVDSKGGDMLQFPEIPGGANRNWLVTQVIETWPDWAKVVVTLQAQ